MFPVFSTARSTKTHCCCSTRGPTRGCAKCWRRLGLTLYWVNPAPGLTLTLTLVNPAPVYIYTCIDRYNINPVFAVISMARSTRAIERERERERLMLCFPVFSTARSTRTRCCYSTRGPTRGCVRCWERRRSTTLRQRRYRGRRRCPPCIHG